ncbi:MAG TPA: hypothetical protein VNO20_07195 [Solirubrobacterales bacterium]|nr:hypothetical protein [Solirubrobacterales bacterium]
MEPEQSENFIDPEVRPPEQRKQEAEAAKVEAEARKTAYEAKREGERAQHERKHLWTTLSERWLYLGVVVLSVLAGIAVVAAGIITSELWLAPFGVSILVGASGGAAWGLSKARPTPDDE